MAPGGWTWEVASWNWSGVCTVWADLSDTRWVGIRRVSGKAFRCRVLLPVERGSGCNRCCSAADPSVHSSLENCRVGGCQCPSNKVSIPKACPGSSTVISDWSVVIGCCLAAIGLGARRRRSVSWSVRGTRLRLRNLPGEPMPPDAPDAAG